MINQIELLNSQIGDWKTESMISHFLTNHALN